jgi:hypothetical protein
MSSEFSAQQYAMMARLVPGRQLAGYVIEEQVGAGGQPAVSQAGIDGDAVRAPERPGATTVQVPRRPATRH